MSLTDPSDPINPAEAREGVAENQSDQTSLPASQASPPAGQSAGQPEGQDTPSDADGPRRRILIGSQRDPAAYRARPRRDWTAVDEPPKEPKRRLRGRKGEARRGKAEGTAGHGPLAAAGEPVSPALADKPPVTPDAALADKPPVAPDAALADKPPVTPSVATAMPQQLDVQPSAPQMASSAPSASPTQAPAIDESALAALQAALSPLTAPLSSVSLPPPNIRERLPADLEDELNRAMGDATMDDLMSGGSQADQPAFEPDSLQSGQVVGIRRDDVFVEFSGRQQGIVSLRLFDVPPRPGTTVQVVVQRFNPEDEMYELSLPNKAVQVDDWSDLVEGAMVEVRVTGHNTGGLECEVNHIRGFIPISQVSLYRVEDLAQFVDQRFACLITEADPDRRNLVLSRRAVLEREREQAREQMLNSLRPGQIHEGVVRKLMDFGAFVDIGGIDGLLHISQLAWGRVKHPSDVLQEGQTIKVRVEKVDPTTGKISFGYRDLMESPWSTASQKYPPNAVVLGRVTKLMDFGAFVELEPGIEGLVHISELSHKRVWRASDVVHEGDQVEVFVLSVDAEAQRISLSMKALAAPPEPAKKQESAGEAAPAKASKKSSKPAGPLLGGLSRSTGDRFGLKW